MIILGVDLGKVRTGLAVSARGEMLASPAGVIAECSRERLADKISAVAKERGAELLVLGLPRNMDGSEGKSAQNAREMGKILAERSGLPVEFCDERGTTITAHGFLNETNTRGKKRKDVVDTVAATVILQNYLEYRRNISHK